MGMDVYGKAATSKVGEYFRNNYWWWRPLARFIKVTCPDLYAKCQCWETNDGDGLNAVDAMDLASRLDILCESGETARYAESLKAGAIDDGLPREAYPFSVENVRKFSEFCRASGGFEIC